MAGWFDAVRAGLWDMLCDGSVIRDANFLKLTKPEDGDNFKEDKFSQHCLDHFQLILSPNARRCPLTLRITSISSLPPEGAPRPCQKETRGFWMRLQHDRENT